MKIFYIGPNIYLNCCVYFKFKQKYFFILDNIVIAFAMLITTHVEFDKTIKVSSHSSKHDLSTHFLT